MTGKESGAYELNHRGRIHRAADFDQLLSWVMEYRVTSKDSYRKAGADEWLSVMSRREFASILNPDNQWSVSMASGVFRAPDFDTVVGWAKEGRITEDAVVEGPRTPPGGVKASALPAVSPHLRDVPGKNENAPWLKIDGRMYRAPDTEMVKNWIRESRVPLEAEFSLDGKNWEPVSSCGLFDLEDWPGAAHGSVEDEYLPEMPTSDGKPEVLSNTDSSEIHSEKQEIAEQQQDEEPEIARRMDGEVPFTVITAETEVTVESVPELKRLLKKRVIFSYDDIKHPTIGEETVSVGEYLEKLRKSGKKRAIWMWAILTAFAAAFCLLELTEVINVVEWL